MANQPQRPRSNIIAATIAPVSKRPALRGLIAGLVGGIAWLVGIMLFFGPAQIILADPNLQSAKMLSAFVDDPPPRMIDQPWLLPVALLAIGMLWGLIYIWIAAAWKIAWWKRGLRFAVIAWVLMVPWFQFYLPFNVLREPLLLVMLEAACWAGVMLCVGLTIAGIDALLRAALSDARTMHE